LSHSLQPQATMHPTRDSGTGAPDSCLVCAGQLAPARLPGLLRCSVCGFVTANLDLTDEALRAIYGRDYFHGGEYLDYEREAESLRLNFRRRIAVLRKLKPDLAAADLFEVGCAYGYFLQEVRPFVHKASGIDISADAVRAATDQQQVDAREGDYLRFELERRVDVVAIWDTIEHLRRPDLVIAKAARDLEPGGLLAITTGDIGSLVGRSRGGRWRMIHPPTHLHYFSVATLSRLLDRLGFDLAHVSHPGNSRKLRSVLYFMLVLKGNSPGVYRLLQRLPLFNLGVTVNLFDIMYVVARRRAAPTGTP
jgi:SAM-dependent methyltransferase